MGLVLDEGIWVLEEREEGETGLTRTEFGDSFVSFFRLSNKIDR